MSLFPAYSSNQNNQDNTTGTNEEWLSNSSYKIDHSITDHQNENILTDSNESSSNDIVELKPSLKERKQKKSYRSSGKVKHKKSKYDFNEEVCSEDFSIDKVPQRVYLTVKTISRPAVPKYKIVNILLDDKVKCTNRLLKTRRYFNCKYSTNENQKDVTTKDGGDDKTQQEKEEANISQKTSYYNQELGKNVFNIDLWLEYIKFQDIIWSFEKNYRKGSTAKAARATAEKKLAIIDKALIHNPGNILLLRERLKTCEAVYPTDELKENLRKLVDKDPDNIILWQGYIEATQCSMANCNTTAVVSIYNECLSKLHQLRRNSLVEKSILEERILSMLYQCGLFLKQAGLWEQLWTLLRLYLVLNLAQSDKNKFNISSNVNDAQLLELEEVILDSKLPLHELWLRIERLRESCHWLPWMSNEPCEDPQRTVFVDDVSDLIHPITSTGNVFKLTVMILTLLKVPLLPFRHSTLQQLGLDYVPWALDSVEILLPVHYPLSFVDTSKVDFLNNILKLSVGPQYLKTHPGQEEYLEFLVTVMRRCGECLESSERTAIFIWWLRFEKLLIVLDREKKFRMPAGRLKKVKSAIKEFLKHPDNRNNVLFYREYALIEFELGNFDSACKILLTAISMLTNDDKVISVLNEETRTNLCNLYRTLVEIHLMDKTDVEKNKKNATRYLILMVDNTCIEDTNIPENILIQAINKYKVTTTELLCTMQNIMSLPDHFLPDFMTDWIICHSLLVYLVKSPFESGTIIERALTSMEESNSDILWRREVLMEWYTSMLYKNCTENLGQGLFKLCRDILNRSLTQVPNNLYLLTIASMEQSISGSLSQSWWQLSNILINSGHSLPALFLIIIMNHTLTQRAEQWNDYQIGNPIQALSSIKNRMFSTFSRFTKTTMCSRRCGLIWRLYLQFLYSYSDPESCRKVYYTAVEECPWLKALYIDAAIYIPAELSQIQDLIIEKELRIHVTPEELEVLRT